MAAEKTYRAAAIGRTNKGGYGHGLHTCYQGIERVEFVAVADEDDEGRQAGQEATGAPRAYADYRQMLEREKPDIVSVCPRWTDCHLEMVSACLEAGAHVYCEKPMTWNLADGDRIIELAAQVKRKVAVAHQAVYLPRVQHLKRILAEGRIGRVEAIYAHGKQDRRGGGEDMIVLGTHLFNMMRFFAGDIAWMSAHVTDGGSELDVEHVRQAGEPVGPIAGDCVNSYFAFANGIAGFFDSRRYTEGGGMRYGMEIVGSQGRIALRGGAGSDLMIYPHPVLTPGQDDQVWLPLEEAADEPLPTGNQLAIIDLIEAAEQDRQPISSAADAVAALEMILGAYQAQISGARVAFPMQQRRHPLQVWQEGEHGG
ncbi:MAG: hypothetical protein GKR89_23975 [Candidatus Latescibacteria bacterium]|nr:hypothetical protein [Candidatus Latescibacterota bacterium]